MRYPRPIFTLCSLILVVVGACAPQTATAPSAASPTNTPVPASTAAPVATPTVQAIALAGPPMEVGSMWPYVDGSILVAVPGGDFTMGHGGSDNPEHVVTLSDYWIYQAKVTNQQYALCVQAGDCKEPDPIDDFTFRDVTHANDPVVGVNYQQSSDYCSFVHGRLPTEAEWEKAARGPDGNTYPWGGNEPVCDLLNFNNCVKKITDVTSYPDGQSYYHALDMEGNVFEWVADWYDALYYRNGDAKDPLGPEKGQQRSVRSSSYKSKTDQIPASTRFFDAPKDHRRDLGFRCVVDDPTYFAPLCVSNGALKGSSGKPDCPKVNIGLTEDCQGGKVQVVILDDHSPDPVATVTVDSSKCSDVLVKDGVFPQIYNCTGDTQVGINTFCSSTGSTTCGGHYKLNSANGTCDWDGSITAGKNCLPGLTYDPVKQCCSAQPGSGKGYKICGLGSALAYVSGNPVCVPNGQAVNDPTHVEPVHVQDPSTCTSHGEGNTITGPCPVGQALVCSFTDTLGGGRCYCK